MPKEFFQSAAATTILKGVSRSFYLSLRLLPAGMRDGAGLGYLLARSSDTIADTTGLAVDERLSILDQYETAVMRGQRFTAPQQLLEVCTAKERNLLEKSTEILAWLDHLDPAVQALVRDVLATILKGQRLDLVRFGHANEQQFMVLQTREELLDYCYLVAGCVGEFWTKLGFHSEGERFSRQPLAVMLPWAKHFGQALQLVNILRDLPEDVRAGRFYLPATGHLLAGPAMLTEHRYWLQTARSLLGDGLRYSEALYGRKLRAATVLPALLAEETLDKMQSATWEQLALRVKVNRATVFRCLAESLLF